MAHRVQMVAKPCGMDAIIGTGIGSSPSGAAITSL
jgi:hypothetical protein